MFVRCMAILGAFAKLRKATISFAMCVCPAVRPSAYNSAPIGRNFVKYDIWTFFENLSRKFKFHWNLTGVTSTLHEDLCTRSCHKFCYNFHVVQSWRQWGGRVVRVAVFGLLFVQVLVPRQFALVCHSVNMGCKVKPCGCDCPSQLRKIPFLHFQTEPSALEGLVRGFISSPYFSLQGYRPLIGPSWRRERYGRSFLRFPLGKRFLSRSFLFQLLFWSFRLGFSSLTLVLPRAGARGSFFSCLFQDRPTQTSGHVRKVNV